MFIQTEEFQIRNHYSQIEDLATRAKWKNELAARKYYDYLERWFVLPSKLERLKAEKDYTFEVWSGLDDYLKLLKEQILLKYSKTSNS